MRTRLAELGEPVPPFAAVSGPEDVLTFAADHGWPVVLKAVRGGYDGRGVWILDDAEQARSTVDELLAAGTPLMVEQRVALRRELAVLLARSPFGQAAVWPVVETVQEQGICTEVLAPAPGLDPERAEEAEELALRIAAAVGRRRAARRRALRDRGRACSSTNSPCARTTRATGRSRAR